MLSLDDVDSILSKLNFAAHRTHTLMMKQVQIRQLMLLQGLSRVIGSESCAGFSLCLRATSQSYQDEWQNLTARTGPSCVLDQESMVHGDMCCCSPSSICDRQLKKGCRVPLDWHVHGWWVWLVCFVLLNVGLRSQSVSGLCRVERYPSGKDTKARGTSWPGEGSSVVCLCFCRAVLGFLQPRWKPSNGYNAI